MASFPVAIERLKISTSSARSGDVSSARSVYRALCEVSRAIAGSAESELVATSALNALEELFSNRNIIIGKAFQSVVQSVYVEVLATTPGYAVRNVINSLMSIIANKNLSVASKECAVLVIGSVMEKRSFDLGSLMTDVVAGMTKLLKGSEIALRIAALAALKNICDGGGSLLTDCHAEMLRTSGKLMSDRSADVRAGVGSLFSSVAANSAGCSSVPADTILSAALRGLEDEIPCVQEKFAFAIACVYNELMLAYVIEQEKSKVGQARGGASDTEKSSSTRDSGRRGSVMKLKDLSSVKDMLSSGLGKKSTEDYDFRSVVKSLIKQTVKASQSHHRAAFIVVLQFLVDMAFPTLDVADIEWLFSALFSSLSEPAIVSLSYEDIVYFRSRLAHLLRFISSKIVELNQLRLSTFICTYLLDSSSPRTEHEIQLAFSELGQLVAALGEASASSVGVFNEVTTIYLRHSSFGVRASAAHVLVGLATVVPALASGYFSSALAAAREQVSLLLKGDPGVAGAEVEGAGTGDIAAVDMAIDMVISSSSGQDSPASEIGLRAPRKGPKEIERLKTMFFFHGQILLLSTFLKQEKRISTGLPKVLVLDAFDFGLDMLILEVFSVDAAVRHVVCSIIRAGSLVISSCLNMGYRMINSRISKLLSSCSDILFATTNDRAEAVTGPSAVSPNQTMQASSPDLLYELMSVEAALVCISALLWFCPESLILNEHFMELVVDGLDIAFHAIKGKYQNKFRTHFRFRTLHVILLECYSWLPYGSFPSTCQQLFVEGLRTFRDSISTGYESTGLPNCINADHRILSLCNPVKGSTVSFDTPLTENHLMLRLEQNAIALQKKESEAFLASFTKDNSNFARGALFSSEWIEPLSPCAFIDSRTVDAAISLVGATFGSQSEEFQDKAIELCSQILVQVQKSANSVGIFTSDEEKRRRDRHALLSTKNTVTLLFNIIESFPVNADSNEPRTWVNVISDKLFDLLASNTNSDIRSAAVNAMSKLCSKPVGHHLTEAISIRIIQSIKSCTDKKTDNADSTCGYMIALSSLWAVALEKPTLQAAMSTIIFDTLKRYEYSPLIRGSVIFSLACIVRSKAVGQGCNDVQDTIALISRVCDAAEGHLLCGNGNGNTDGLTFPGDFDFLLVCLQRLINATVLIMMAIDPASNLMFRLFQLWETIRLSSSHVYVERECIEFIVGASMFPTDALSCRAASLYLQKALLRRSDSNVEILQTAVAALRALMIRNCKVVCEVGIDIDLFKLLDWSVASAYPLCTAPYWGLELRSGLGAVIDTSQSLQRSIELALDAVVGIDVQQRPQDASVRWVLLCRSIALGASSSSLKQTSIEPVQDAAVMESDENVDDKRKQPSYTTESAHMTYQQFVTLMREKGALKASPLTSARCRLRYVALQCSTVAILGAGRHHAHYDLHLSRIETQILLKSLPANFTDHDLDTIPCYLALFLQDIVNMACACASFTIEDNKQTALQGAAVDCLNVVVSLFWDSADPDVLRVESGLIGKSNSILELYIAQIVSALRPCLSTQWCPPLLLTSGALLCELLRRSLLKDRTVVRRLLKALTGNCVVEGEQLNIRAAESDEVAEEISTIQYVVNMTNLARIYLLCLDSGLCRNISPEIKTAILSSISPWMDGLTSAWENISLDGVRLLQGYKRWQKAVPETDPRRGGASYSCTAETPKLRGYYEYALPFVTVANLVGRPDVESSFLPASFFILESLLENLAMLPKSQFEVKLFMRSVAESGGFVRLSRSFLEPLLCRGLAIICERFVVANQRSDTDFVEKPEDTAELSRLLLFFGRDVIPNRASPTSNFSDFISLSIEITDALSALLPAIRLTEKLTPQCDDMWCWSWIVAISLLDSLFDDLLVTGGGTATLVNSIRDYALSVESGDNSYSAENEVLFPSIHVCPNVSVDECEKLNGMLSSDVLVNLLNVIIELCRLRRCWKCERFVLELSLTVLSRLSFFSFEAFENSITRKSILAMLPRICMHSGGFSNLETADSAKKLRGSKPSDLLVHSLTEWFHFYNHNGESIRSVFAVSTYRMRAVVDTIFTAWVSIEHVSNFMGPVEPLSLASLLLLSENDYRTEAASLFQSELLQLLVQYVDKFSAQMKKFLFTCFFPAAVLRLSVLDVPNNSALAISLVELLFYCVTTVSTQECKTLMIQQMLTPLCAALDRSAAIGSFGLACGVNLTHVAKSNPEMFKSQVIALTDNNRAVLQNSMRLAILQQGQATSTQQSSGTQLSGIGSSSSKRIDLSRFKKI